MRERVPLTWNLTGSPSTSRPATTTPLARSTSTQMPGIERHPSKSVCVSRVLLYDGVDDDVLLLAHRSDEDALEAAYLVGGERGPALGGAQRLEHLLRQPPQVRLRFLCGAERLRL